VNRERIAVGRALRRRLGADRAARAAAVLDDDRLSEAFGESLLDDAGDDVRSAAGRVGHDETDRLRRVVLRERR
jgi:hypothetical protein